MKVGYVRVSTTGQNTARQEVLMQELGVERIFIDRMSGKNTSRPELKRMMEFVCEGDVVIVESISRFARCTRDLLELVEQLTAKGVEFVSKKESLDTSSPSGRFVLTIFGAVAQLEREYLLERQREGIAIAKEQGKYTGRKLIQPVNFDAVMTQWKNGEITAVEAMKQLKMSKSTFYRKVKVISEKEGQ
jgi:DNA invertase Pin-like site-specific DNA recombinase